MIGDYLDVWERKRQGQGSFGFSMEDRADNFIDFGDRVTIGNKGFGKVGFFFLKELGR
jgi:hypothetical protein